jgi:cytochrome c biogenesis protein CcmG, thiol:disulfide interchange protein DsbE
MTSGRQKTGARRVAQPTGGARKKFPIVPVVIGVAVVALVATVVLTFDGEDMGDDPFGTPTVTGAPLTPFASGAADAAVGRPAPFVQGTDFEGNPVAIEDDGRAKMVLFLAHWCPFCQAEVPEVQRWVDAGALPDGVDLYAVTTSTDRMRANYPPSKWLADEGWSSPIIVDDEVTTVARAYGLNAFPYWVFIAADGTVWGRTSGQLGIAVLDDVAQSLASS